MSETKSSLSRLLAKLIRELLAQEKFTHFADLTEALKCRCARLKIRPTNEDISDAFRLIQSNRALIEQPSPIVERRVEEMVLPLSRQEAARLIAEIREHLREMQ